MIDLMKGVKDAVVLALKAGRPAAIGPVYTHIPEGMTPPFSAVLTMSSKPQSRRDQVELVKFSVEHVYRGADPDQMHAALAFNRAAIDRVPLTAAGLAISPPDLIEMGIDLKLTEDGVTHAGFTDFECYAEPAA